jgi:hypothetical protein
MGAQSPHFQKAAKPSARNSCTNFSSSLMRRHPGLVPLVVQIEVVGNEIVPEPCVFRAPIFCPVAFSKSMSW